MEKILSDLLSSIISGANSIIDSLLNNLMEKKYNSFICYCFDYFKIFEKRI